jgi:hypothetical protein
MNPFPGTRESSDRGTGPCEARPSSMSTLTKPAATAVDSDIKCNKFLMALDCNSDATDTGEFWKVECLYMKSTSAMPDDGK